jgi:hypothetical protein
LNQAAKNNLLLDGRTDNEVEPDPPRCKARDVKRGF